ncbi:MAG: restriction endonuclease subunit S [Monoglobaceae bacterium]
MKNVSSSNSQAVNVPKLRFPGFTDEWQTSSIGNFGSFYKGASLSKADISESGTPFILYGELYTTYDEVASEIKRKTEATVGDEYYSQTGDVIIPTSGETPEDIATATCVMKPGVILAGDLCIMRTDRIDGRFLSYTINHKAKFDIARIAQGKSIVHIRPEEVEQVKVRYPSKPEQEKILCFIELLSQKIDKQKSLIEHLKLYKRGVSEAIFSRKLKFEHPYSNWHSYTMNELGFFYNGLSGKGKDDFGKGNASFITYMNVYKNPIGDISMCDVVNVTENEKQNKVQYGDVLFSQSSETLKEVGMSSVWLNDTTPYLNSFCFGFRFNEPKEVYPLYIAYYMRSQKIRHSIMREGQGATRINLSAERMKSIELELPSIEEQKKIGDFIFSLEKKIINEETLLNQMLEMRKSLLQNLFI